MRKENSMRKVSRIYILYFIGTIVIILSIFLASKQTAMGREQKRCMELLRAVDQEEQLYVQNIKKELSKQGFANCGVTMTKMVEGDGEFYYHVQIHHRNFEKVNVEKKEAIFSSLNNLPNEIERILNEEEMVEEVEFIYEII